MHLNITFTSKVDETLKRRTQNQLFFIAELHRAHIKWKRNHNNNCLFHEDMTDPCIQNFIDMFQMNNIKHHVTNRNERILDLVIYPTISISVNEYNLPFIKEDRYHRYLEMKFP